MSTRRAAETYFFTIRHSLLTARDVLEPEDFAYLVNGLHADLGGMKEDLKDALFLDQLYACKEPDAALDQILAYVDDLINNAPTVEDARTTLDALLSKVDVSRLDVTQVLGFISSTAGKLATLKNRAAYVERAHKRIAELRSADEATRLISSFQYRGATMASQIKDAVPAELINRLQIAAVTGTDITLDGEEAKQVFRFISSVSIYSATQGLPEALVALINR